MLFNSYEFIFVFLPLALAGYALLGMASRRWAVRWLILASLAFYAVWRPFNVLIMGPSILINFGIARGLQHLGRRDRPVAANWLLAAGIAFNVVFLGWFKYANFVADTLNRFGTDLTLARIVLPLGISFITFQKIGFLVDVRARRVESFTFQDYCLFVLFFPQLIAGPIVHYREMMPQFLASTGRLARMDVAVGVTLFGLGLFKKVYLADSVAPTVSAIFGAASAGGRMTMVTSWMAAVGYTFQMYFDFSGYSDMALGLARLFGVRFPPNFLSPLRATSIIDFWLRWHMTLTRFLTAYVYNPLSLALTRRHLASGLPGLVGGRTTPGAFLVLLVLPTMLTMTLSGVWHGAGFLFVAWGALHGVYLVINHAWRMFVARRWQVRARYQRRMAPVGFALTFVAVAAAMVLFRATNVRAATGLLLGMTGLHGVALPAVLMNKLGPLAGPLGALGVHAGLEVEFEFIRVAKLLVLLGVIAFLCPNTLELLRAYEPALGVGPNQTPATALGRRVAWRPSLAWAAGIAAIAAVAVLHLSAPTEFLYWQF